MGFFKRKQSIAVNDTEVEQVWPSDDAPGFVIIDLETTGLSPNTNRIIEVGLIRTDLIGNPLGAWSTLVNPEQPMGATDIHGIRESDVFSAPTFDECVSDIMEKIKGHALVAHNASFDHSFLRSEFVRSGWDMPEVPLICTMLESRHFLPSLTRARLIDCVAAIGINQSVQHRALGDAALTSALLHFYLNGPTNAVRSSDLKTVPNLAAQVVWPEVKTYPAKTSNSSKKMIWRSLPVIPKNSEILKKVSRVSPQDFLSEEAQSSEMSYVELLLDVLSDGIISDSELVDLGDCAIAIGLNEGSLLDIHKRLLRVLSFEAWRDGVVNRAEQQDVINCAQLLGLSAEDGRDALREIEELRNLNIETNLKLLPLDWEYGEPLRVGDRVAITGCYELGRYELESQARSLGVRVTTAVSRLTSILVSDGSIGGNKDADAKRLGIRVVHPSEFRILLDYVQPSVVQNNKEKNRKADLSDEGSRSGATENLVCTKCGASFVRVVAKGRKPHFCPKCR